MFSKEDKIKGLRDYIYLIAYFYNSIAYNDRI